MPDTDFSWSNWGGSGDWQTKNTFGPEDTIQGDPTKEVAYSWDYNPDKTWRRQMRSSQYYIPPTDEAPMTSVYGNWGTTWTPNYDQAFQRLVDGNWVDYSSPTSEEATYLWAGVNDPRVFGANALKDDPLHDFLYNNPNSIGQLNQRYNQGVDQNVYQGDENVQAFLSAWAKQQGVENQLGDLYNPESGAAWADYMSVGSQHNRDQAREKADLMEGLKWASMIGGGVMGLNTLVGGLGSAGINAGVGAFGGGELAGVTAADVAAGMIPESMLSSMGVSTGGLSAAGTALGSSGLMEGSGLAAELASGAPELGLTDMFSFDPASLAEAGSSFSSGIPSGINPNIANEIMQGLSEQGFGDLTSLSNEISKGMGGSMWDNIGRWFNNLKPTDWVKGGAALLDLFNKYSASRDMEKTGTNLANEATPLDRSFFAEEAKRSYTDPFDNPEYSAYKRQARQEAQRAMAKRGMSANPIHTNLAMDSQLAKFLDQRRNTLAQFAGAQFNPVDAYRMQLEAQARGANTMNSGLSSVVGALSDIFRGQESATQARSNNIDQIIQYYTMLNGPTSGYSWRP